GGRGSDPRVRPGIELPASEPTRVRGVAEELSALLASALPKSGLPLRVQAIPFRGTDKKADVQLVVEVLGGGLQFVQSNGQAEERVELAMATVDDHGRVANGRSTSIDLRLPPGELERVRTTGVRWLSELDLPAGRYQLRVAGRAVGTGASGMVTHMVDVPKFERNHLAMSGVTLTSLPSVLMPTRGKRWLAASLDMPPSASRVFVRGDRMTAAVEVYAPDAVRGPVESFAEVTGSATGKTERLIARPAIPERTPNREVAFELDTLILQPGLYVLRISAGSGGSGEHVDRRIAFEVVPAAVPPG
ncbi:MAG: hypothetical protein ABJC51_11015, partial [Acidobacteriota bacterium]